MEFLTSPESQPLQEPDPWSFVNAAPSSAWDVGMEERLEDLQYEFPIQPPAFELPRASVDQLLTMQGPSRSALLRDRDRARQLSHGAFGFTGDKAGYDDDDQAEHERCEADIEWRAAQETCMRQIGCQTILLLCGGVCVVLFLHHHAQARNSTVYTWIVLAAWFFFYIVLACGWVKAMVQCTDTVFFWLGRTNSEIDRSGEFMALRIRRQLFLRVLGLLHCRTEDMQDVVTRLSGGPFTELLRQRMAFFPEGRISPSGYVDSGCSFLDSAGTTMRFMWRIGRPWARAHAGSVLTKIRDDDSHHHFSLRDELLQPWASRDMRYLIDVESEEISAIVRTNPWWEKLEFELMANSSKIGGFRGYLGDCCFNKKERIRTYTVGLPLTLLLVGIITHLHHILRNPEVNCNPAAMLPHACFTIGVGISANLLAFLLSTDWGRMCCVNMAMTALETQVNKDWSNIIGSDLAEDPEDLWSHPEWSGQYYPISVLWQVISSQRSVERLAEQVWKGIVQNRYRHTFLDKVIKSWLGV